ncbi:TAXI family TRAP transporter solute-binding subunit [Tardiphaga robiniae]|uniref:ABC transporter substrate-binding protein n=1 Tax=Tardiphaga robiniae TaxID=943830 RepID=A0A7G6U3Q8_9BRAD|nr:TAXI family TRAP transporter solute-binding subunit [Tardiphaga robiniae]QND73640.1 ABC transporter substrate-binding protein [Tardiphaga robiniae]
MDRSIGPSDTSHPERRARGQKKSLLLTLAAGLAIFSLAAFALQFYLKPTVYRLAVGPLGSEDEKLVQALADTFTKEGKAFRLKPIVTSGASESLSLFADGKADLAIGRGDLDMPKDAEMVAIVRRDFAVLWALSSTTQKSRKPAVKSLEELPGRTVGIIGRTEANRNLFNRVLKASGVDPDKVKLKQFATNQLEELSKDMSIDVVLAVGPMNSKITLSALEATARTRGQPRFLPIDVSEAIAANNPVYSSEEIPGSVFNAKPAWPEDKVETIGVSHLLVAKKALSESNVAALSRQIFSARHSLGRDIPSAAQIRKPDSETDTALPLHSGTAAYVDGNEKTFLDRYSDYIWFSLLALSGIGSAIAWLRKFFMRDEWEGVDALCDKFAALTTKAREAEEAHVLFDLNDEADALMDETVEGYNDGAIDEEDLSILNLMIQRFYHAAAIRQRWLDNNANGEKRVRVV